MLALASGSVKVNCCPQSAGPKNPPSIAQGMMSVGKMSTNDDRFKQLATENNVF
jgi:hypothetical protein